MSESSKRVPTLDTAKHTFSSWEILIRAEIIRLKLRHTLVPYPTTSDLASDSPVSTIEFEARLLKDRGGRPAIKTNPSTLEEAVRYTFDDSDFLEALSVITVAIPLGFLKPVFQLNGPHEALKWLRDRHVDCGIQTRKQIFLEIGPHEALKHVDCAGIQSKAQIFLEIVQTSNTGTTQPKIEEHLKKWEELQQLAELHDLTSSSTTLDDVFTMLLTFSLPEVFRSTILHLTATNDKLTSEKVIKAIRLANSMIKGSANSNMTSKPERPDCKKRSI
jgi:hypothetical protein